MSFPATTGTQLIVGSGQQYTSLHAAVEAAAPGDTILVTAGNYVGSLMTITKNLTIVGSGNPTITFNGGVGPYIRLSGDNVNVKISDINFIGVGVNTAVLGDINLAYGPQLPGVNQTFHLINVNISTSGGDAIYAVKPTTSYNIQGGQYSADYAAMIFGDAAQVSIRPSTTGQGTMILSQNYEGIQLFSGMADGWLTVRGASFSVPAASSSIRLYGGDLFYAAVAENTHPKPTGHFSWDGATQDPPSAPFSLSGGVATVLSVGSPDMDGEHWLAL